MAGIVRVSAFCVSVDGFSAALGQSQSNPFGVGGMVLPAWLFPTRFFQVMQGKAGDTGKIGRAHV